MNKKNIKIIIFIMFIAMIIQSLELTLVTNKKVKNLVCKMEGKNIEDKYKGKIKSANLSVDYEIDKALKDAKELQLNTMNVPVIINIESISANEMEIDKKSEKKAIEIIKKLKEENIKVILEPYPWIKNGECYETDWNPKDKNKFFHNWKNNVLKKLIDDIANPYGVEAMYIASNFVHMEHDEQAWCNIIDFVKENYKGKVSYRTNWWVTSIFDKKTKEDFNKKINNKLFSKLDFISIAAYFELTNSNVNTVNDLVRAIYGTERYNRRQDIQNELKMFSEKWNKPIFFGELGFPKRNRASVEPWNPIPSNKVNNKEQANCFEAYRKVFEDEDWHLGFSVFAVGKDDKEKNYYPSKEAKDAIRKWYNPGTGLK